MIDPCKGGHYPWLGFPDLLILFLLFVTFYFPRFDLFNLYQRPHHLSFLSYSLTYIAWVCFTTFWGAENKLNVFKVVIYVRLWRHHMPFAIHMLYCFQHVFPIVTFHTCHYLYGNKSCISQLSDLLKGKTCSLLEEHLSHCNYSIFIPSSILLCSKYQSAKHRISNKIFFCHVIIPILVSATFSVVTIW